MVQQITTKYQEFNTSEVQNRRFIQVVPAGIYSGYALSVNAGIVNIIDITSGADTISTLVTPGGSVVTESSAIAGAFRVDAADPSFDRIDALVGEYTYSTNPNAVLEYKVVRGRNQLSVGSTPELPRIDEATQVLLGHVYITAGADRITNSDLRPAVPADHTTQETWSNLQPVVTSGDNRILYVFPGTFLSSDGTAIVQFEGGYSSVIQDTTFANNTERWYLFALSDSGEVLAKGFTESAADLAEVDADTFAVCQARVRMNNGRPEIISLRDLRLPFSRSRARNNEDLKYQDLLADSVFRYLRVENFEDESSLVLDATENGTASVDSATQSLRITGTSSQETVVVTNDILEGSSISIVEQFLAVFDSLVDNLTFDYSTVSPLSGFTGDRYAPGELINLSNTFATKLYLKLYIPGSEFAVADFTSIFSYGVLLNFDGQSTNGFSIEELGLRELKSNVENLIANGDFYYWSRNTSKGKAPDLLSSAALEFNVSEENPTLADGWQLTNINSDFSTGAVRRIFDSQPNSPTAIQLQYTGIDNSQDSAPTVLEYRIPRGRSLSGNRLTFAINARATVLNSVTIGIGQYQRVNGELILVESDEKTLTEGSATLTVQTAAAVAASTEVVSFYIKMSGGGVGQVVTFSEARAAVGAFAELPFTYSTNAASQLQSYFERGRFYAAGAADVGTIVGSSTQFGAPKHLELGDLVTQTGASVTSDRSSNVNNITYTGDRSTITASGTASSASAFILQTEWEAFVKYTGGVI